MSAERPRWIAIVVYTVLRVLLLLAVWGLITWLTPLQGLWALALALLISGSISLFVLDRQRDEMSVGVARFFSGINERIDASARAEDPPLEPREPGSHDDAVGKHE